ncbi:MAG: Hsp20/alpha crystallin family protein [Spirochaeta sp.]|nr:Hsp20/alpha crystallin family protein [Spirochaeta sp.]
MKGQDFPDIGRIMDQLFEAAEDFKANFGQGMGYGPGAGTHPGAGTQPGAGTPQGERGFPWGETKDYYPAYSYPPANVYLREDKCLVFEFAVAGFTEADIDLTFKGEYMYLAISGSERLAGPENIHYFKRRLKFKDVKDQKYYVPEDKFDRDAVAATLTNGILEVVIPPKESPEQSQGIRVNIKKGTADEFGAGEKQ